MPGATTSGLKRPNAPSMPTPTLPRLEKAATSLLVSVSPSQGWLVWQTLVPSTVVHCQTWSVIERGWSMAPDGNDVLGGGGRLDGVRVAARAVVGAIAGVAGAEHKEQRLGAGDLGQSVADGGIVAGGGKVVGVVVRVVPTVVGDEGVGAGGGFLEIGVGGRPGIGAGGDGEELRGGGQAAELEV